MRAVVDIGSNSVKFAIADVQRGVPVILKKKSWVTRLGRGLEKTGLLSAESIQATEEALKAMASEMATYGTGLQIEAVATSAVRDCKNPGEITGRVQKILNVPLRVLSGMEEAHYSLLGASAAGQACFGTKDNVYVDVGGASTEVGIVTPRFEAFSFQAGAVRCHEKLGLDRIPVTDAVWRAAQSGMEKFFPPEKWDPLAKEIPATHSRAVAVGGSLIVSAKLAGAARVTGDDGELIGFTIKRSALEKFNDGFRKLSMEERLARPNVEKGRADILCAGVLCLTTVLARLGLEEMLITDWGLRYGLLLERI